MNGDTSYEAGMANEDDEMLEMRLQLDDIKAKKLRRRMELKRRRANVSTSISSSSAFSLSRELSMQIDRDRAQQLDEVKAHNESLQNELNHLRLNYDDAKTSIAERLRNEMHEELEIFKQSMRAQLVNEFQSRAAIDLERQGADTIAMVELRTNAEHEIAKVEMQNNRKVQQVEEWANDYCAKQYAQISELQVALGDEERAEGQANREVTMLRQTLATRNEQLQEESVSAIQLAKRSQNGEIELKEMASIRTMELAEMELTKVHCRRRLDYSSNKWWLCVRIMRRNLVN